jgi:hypothetical protein
MSEALAEVLAAQRRLDTAREALAAASKRRAVAIGAAVTAGIPVVVIAETLGITHQAVRDAARGHYTPRSRRNAA